MKRVLSITAAVVGVVLLAGCGNSKLDVTSACQRWDEIRPGIGGGSAAEFPDRLADLAENTKNIRLAYLLNESWRTTEHGDEASSTFAMTMVDNYCLRRS